MRSTTNFVVFFRVDASLDIGTGHVMRCLTLANVLHNSGAVCQFICRTHHGNLIDRVRDAGYIVHTLPVAESLQQSSESRQAKASMHASWLGADMATDAQQTLAVVCEEESVDWLIVDHYAIDADWERSLRAAAKRIMVIDDLQDRNHQCEILIDQNLGHDASDYDNLVPTGCNVLCGPEYALLSPEFAALRSYSLERREQPALQRILIGMGGVDKNDHSGKILNALRSCTLPAECEITVAMGRHAPWLDRVCEIATTMPRPTEVLVDSHNMAKLMADSDLAIGAAGTTAWERCCLGLPALTIVLAENQRASANALQSEGAIVLLDERKNIASELRQKLQLFENSDLLLSMSRVSRSITDGSGVLQVGEALLNA